MVGAKLHIHSDEEISPENPSPHSPPPPPAVRNRQTRRRRRKSPLPTPRSDPLRGMRRPRARRERGAKLSEVEERFPVSSTPSPPTPTRDTLDFGGGLRSGAALPVPLAPPPAMPVPVAPPPLFSDPKSRRRLPISFFRFTIICVLQMLMLTRLLSNLIFVNFPLATATCSGYMMENLSSLMNEYEDMRDLTPDTDLLKELPDDYTCETALADLIDNSLQAL